VAVPGPDRTRARPIQTGAAQAIVGGAPADLAGIASALQATSVQLGGVLGLSILGSIITSRVSSVLPQKLLHAGVPGQLAAHLERASHAVAQGIVPIPRGISAGTAHAISAGAQNAFTSGLDLAMMVGAALAFLAAISAFLFVRPAHEPAAAAESPHPTTELGVPVSPTLPQTSAQAA
jgi:hypothetical protein